MTYMARKMKQRQNSVVDILQITQENSPIPFLNMFEAQVKWFRSKKISKLLSKRKI